MKKENTQDNPSEKNENLQEIPVTEVGSTSEEVVSEKPKPRTRVSTATSPRTRSKVVKETTVTEVKEEEVLEETISESAENSEIMKDSDKEKKSKAKEKEKKVPHFPTSGGTMRFRRMATKGSNDGNDDGDFVI